MATPTASSTWGRDFDPDRLAGLELRMWKAYYRRQPVRLATLLVQANREQARASWPRSVGAAFYLARAAAGFGRSTRDYDRFLPDIVRGYRLLGLPATVDAESVARQELRWWGCVVVVVECRAGAVGLFGGLIGEHGDAQD